MLAAEDIPLRRFPHLQLEFVTSQQQFIDHMPPFRSRVVIPDPLQVVTARELGFKGLIVGLTGNVMTYDVNRFKKVCIIIIF